MKIEIEAKTIQIILQELRRSVLKARWEAGRAQTEEASRGWQLREKQCEEALRDFSNGRKNFRKSCPPEKPQHVRF